MRSAPSGRLSFLGLAWRHLAAEKESSAGVTVILLLALLPVVLLFVDWSSARTDLQAVVGASDGVTVQKTGAATAQAFDAFQQQAQGQVARHLGQYLDAGDGLGTEGPFRVDSINSQPPAVMVEGVGRLAAVLAAKRRASSLRVEVASQATRRPAHRSIL